MAARLDALAAKAKEKAEQLRHRVFSDAHHDDDRDGASSAVSWGGLPTGASYIHISDLPWRNAVGAASRVTPIYASHALDAQQGHLRSVGAAVKDIEERLAAAKKDWHALLHAPVDEPIPTAALGKLVAEVATCQKYMARGWHVHIPAPGGAVDPASPVDGGGTPKRRLADAEDAVAPATPPRGLVAPGAGAAVAWRHNWAKADLGDAAAVATGVEAVEAERAHWRALIERRFSAPAPAATA